MLARGANARLANSGGITALMCAARIDGQVKNPAAAAHLVSLLLRQPDAEYFINKANVFGTTALHFAVQSQDLAVVNLLLQGT